MGTIVDPAPFDLTVYQGATCRLAFVWKVDGSPVDLTGAIVRAQVRNRFQSPVLASFVCSGADDGRVTAALPATVTAALVAAEHRWDLEVHWLDGDVCRLLMGSCVVSPEVTR